MTFITSELKENGEPRYSASTLHTRNMALCKVFGIEKSDEEFFSPPTRHRSDIKRSRMVTSTDSITTIDPMAQEFCKCTGMRHYKEFKKVVGGSLFTLQNVKDMLQYDEAFLNEYLEFNAQKPKSFEDERIALNDVNLYEDKFNYFIRIIGKGGRVRYLPVVGNEQEVENVVRKMQETPKGHKVFGFKNDKNWDIHALRAEYAARVYRTFARDVTKLPRNERYDGRCDAKGLKFDKKALLIGSKALGHNRLQELPKSYLWTL